MNIDEAIELAKLQEQEKVPMSLKVPLNVKQTLQNIADENDISLNILTSSILDNYLNGTVSTNAYHLYQEFKEVSDKLLEICVPNNGMKIDNFLINYDALEGDESYIYSLIDKYNVLKSILGVKKCK